MSDWASSLGYSAADVFSDSDDDGVAEDEPLRKSPDLKPVEEESVKFTETPFTIAARNAQWRKARQPTLPPVEQTGSSSTSQQQHTEQPLQRLNAVKAPPQRQERSQPTLPPPGHASTSTTSQQPFAQPQSRNASAPRSYAQEHLLPWPPSRRQAPTSSIPSEAIVISDESDDEVEITKELFRGGPRSDVATQSDVSSREEEGPVTKGEHLLQRLFEEDRDFYESLNQEMAAKERALSDGASSVQMESMVPDGSTSYDTGSFAPTYTTHRYPSGYEPPVPVVSPYAPAAVDAYGRPLQYAPISRAATPAQMRTYHPGYSPTPIPPHAQPFLQPYQHLYLPSYQQPHQQPLSQPYPPTYAPPYPQPQPQSWQYAAPVPPYAYGPQSPVRPESVLSFRRPRTPTRAQADKAKADMIYRALQGSKRSKSKTQTPPVTAVEKYGKEDEWSTLKASRTSPDGTLSLTAALRRPLPATRLPQSSRGGSRLAMPLYRPVGSTAEARRRAETLMIAGPSRPRASERSQAASSSSSSSFSAKRLGTTAAGPTRASKLFRPSPLTDKGKGVARN